MFALISCKHRPSYVLSPEKMSKVMADIYEAEAVIDANRGSFMEDSSKIALKQSILDSHKISQEDLDTSLVWYGHNMDKYLEMCDLTITELESRSKKLGNEMSESAGIYAGDSVDLWYGSRYVLISDKMPSRLITFDYEADDSHMPGDVYVWRMKLLDPLKESAKIGIVANYADSTVAYSYAVTSKPDWNVATFVTDSTKQLVRMRGFFDPGSLKENKYIWVDSISLIRRQNNPDESNFAPVRSHTYKSY